MPLSAISQQRLALVHPRLATAIVAIDAAAPEVDVQVTQGLRTWAEQDALYAEGRTAPGKIVTHAPGGYSWHNLGLAVDIVPEDITPGQPDWDILHPVWARLVSIAENLGLVSGAEWHGDREDTPHLQLTGRFPVTPDDSVRALYEQGGLPAVWEASGLFSVSHAGLLSSTYKLPCLASRSGRYTTARLRDLGTGTRRGYRVAQLE